MTSTWEPSGTPVAALTGTNVFEPFSRTSTVPLTGLTTTCWWNCGAGGGGGGGGGGVAVGVGVGVAVGLGVGVGVACAGAAISAHCCDCAASPYATRILKCPGLA